MWGLDNMLAVLIAGAVLTSPIPLSAADWQRSIRAGYAAGRREFSIPAGTYRLSQPVGDFYVEMADLTGVRLKADGVTFLLPDPGKGGLRFSRCKKVSVSGLTIRHDPLPFTQGKIVAMSSDAKSYTVELANGYPSNMDNPVYFPPRPTGYVFDPRTRQWKRGTYDLSFTSVSRVGDRTFRFDLANPVHHAVALNDLMAFRGVGRQMIVIDHCANMDMQDVTVEASGGFGIHEDEGDGDNHYRRFRVTYPPKPVGAEEDPLMSNGADAFHSSGVRVGPKIEDCTLEGMPDDGIAIHGMYGQIASRKGARLVVGTIYGIQAEVGDTYRIYDSKGNLKGEALIEEIKRHPGYIPSRKSSFDAFASPAYFDVSLDRTVLVDFDGLVCSKERFGAGFVVKNNVIRNNRARGILIKSSDGLVEGNTIDGSTISGILVAPEAYWMEADFARNVKIRGNLIRNTGYATAASWTFPVGAISIVADGLEAMGNQGIVIEHNTFENIDGVNLMVSNAKAVEISNNRFRRTQLHPSDRGADFGIDTSALIWIAHSTMLTVRENILEETQTASAKRIVLGPGVEGCVTDWPASIKK